MGDVTFTGAGLVVITALLTALSSTIALLFRALMASKDASLKDMTSQRDSYQKMASQAIGALELAANRARRARGEAPFQPIPAVVPEHNSPTTRAQTEAAEMETLKARAARAARLLEIPLEKMHYGEVDTDDDDVAMPMSDNPSPAVKLRPGETLTIIGEPLPPE